MFEIQRLNICFEHAQARWRAPKGRWQGCLTYSYPSQDGLCRASNCENYFPSAGVVAGQYLALHETEESVATRAIQGGQGVPLILLIEDDADDVFFFRRTLSKLGYHADVRVVSSSGEAKRYMLKRPIR